MPRSGIHEFNKRAGPKVTARFFMGVALPPDVWQLTRRASIKIMSIVSATFLREFIYREAMMNNDRQSKASCVTGRLRPLIWAVSFAALLLAAACGGETNRADQKKYPVLNDDIEKQLKFDARVEDYETDGDKLVVNVNQAWLASPPGMQERSIGQWFSLWRASLGNGEGEPKESIQVIVRHEGNDLAKWTGKQGYQPVAQPKSQAKDET